ncbi:SMP-30/gluconolactonase/LRE family protein [Nonomuraea sp. NPDC050663]|uniref:SMP-30/gluconolactonase/LRE family protein n=1 Tax=Nonomuraea sp. NPDC050663 TaxID=3364370 RepID=UPI00378E87C9
MTDVFGDVRCELGESALWDGERLYWVDITRGQVHARDWNGGPTRSLAVPGPVGSVALRAGGGLVAALRHAIAFCDVDLGTVEVVREVDEPEGNRLNDGAVDPAGRFWVGSMDLGERSPSGSFYRLDPDLGLTRVFGGIICSNGPAWSPEGDVLYHVDSTRRVIRCYDTDPATGELGPERIFATDHDCYPDGLAVDAEGGVWNCKWDGSRVVRYAPDGTIDRVIRLPVSRPTRCAFAGPGLDVLAVTSASLGSADELAGRVLLVDPGVRGLPAPAFAG